MNELEKPTIKADLDIVIPKLEPVKHNLGKMETFAKDLDVYYKKLIKDTINLDVKTVKSERTKVRKLLKFVEDNRKAMIKAYKEPIKDFEDTSKRIEKILKGTDAVMKEFVDKVALKDAKEETTLGDPFAGLSVNNKCYFKVICDVTQKDLLINFAKENHIEIEEEK